MHRIFLFSIFSFACCDNETVKYIQFRKHPHRKKLIIIACAVVIIRIQKGIEMREVRIYLHDVGDVGEAILHGEGVRRIAAGVLAAQSFH
jgi:hypothetical protein